MNRLPGFFLAFVAGCSVQNRVNEEARPLGSRPIHQVGTHPPATYDDWISAHGSPLKPGLVAATTEVFEDQIDKTPYEAIICWSSVKTDGKVTEDWQDFDFIGERKLESIDADGLQNICSMAAELPDDHKTLPSSTHRVLIEVRTNGRQISRIYDARHPDPKVVEFCKAAHIDLILDHRSDQ